MPVTKRIISETPRGDFIKHVTGIELHIFVNNYTHNVYKPGFPVTVSLYIIISGPLHALKNGGGGVGGGGGHKVISQHVITKTYLL